MEKKGRRRSRRQWIWMLGFSAMAARFLFLSFTLAAATAAAAAEEEEEGEDSFSQRVLRELVENNKSISSPELKLQLQSHGQVIMDNGLVRVILSSPEGDVIGIKYNGIDNLLEIHNEEDNRGYWDVVWNSPNKASAIDRLKGTNFKVITASSDQIEVSFTKIWNPSAVDPSSAPLNVDKRYILRRGYSGFYAYAIFERLDGWPQIDIDQIRIVYKLRKDKFHYMAVSDDRQRIMPMPEDRRTGQPLAYPEAVLLTRPIISDLKGEVDDKYQYSMENQENKVHGWVCRDPPVGFWMITPSDEFRTAGPIKQDLTSHVGPTTLSMFVSTHYAGKEVGMRFGEGEAWKKVFGPVFVYLNSVPTGTVSLWEDAKKRMGIELSGWPYSFAESGDFPSSDQRGTVTGQLLVRDRYARERLMWADSAYVGLAAPGELGSWQRESKGYQFWTRADRKGYFSIKNIRPGNYNLYAWVPGVIGDYKYDGDIAVTPASNTSLSMLVYSPPRRGPTLWEIGIPDRTAAEFYVPDPQPTLMNRLYNNRKIRSPDKFRQYGLWERYADLYPSRDLVYTVGADDYRRHWFFAHVTRATGIGTYKATTWQIVFPLQGAKQTGNYTLRLALASATESVVEVRFNNPTAEPAHFSTGPWSIGKDNAIARHGIHGLYWLFSIDVPSEYLVEEKNIIYLTQTRHRGPFQGVMYDYIRLEGVL